MDYVSGTYEKTIYRSEKTTRTIFRLKLNELPSEDFQYLKVICEGSLLFPLVEMPLKLWGEFKVLKDEESRSEFPTFTFEKAELITTNEEEIRLIPSFRGVSEKTLDKLISEFGVNVFSWKDIPGLSEKLLQIEGIGAKRASGIARDISFHSDCEKVVSFCSSYGEIPYLNKADRPSIEKLKEHPYEYGTACRLSFRVCDCIARDSGFTVNSFERVKALCIEVLTRATNAGNTSFPLERCFNGISYYESSNSAFTGQEVSPYVAFAVLLNSPEFVPYIDENENTFIYLSDFYNEERLLCNSIKRLQHCNVRNNADIKKIICKTEHALGIRYTNEQREAFSFLTESGIHIITGGPGCGKSTIVRGLVYAYRFMHPERTISMMAPTGKAAERLSEIVDDLEASTIHRAFGLKNNNIITNGMSKRLSSKYVCSYPADLIFIDECSMIDSQLAAYALSSVKSGSIVIMLGDTDQLEAVGPGNVLNDILKSEICSKVVLNENFRSGAGSTIEVNASHVNKGETDELIEDDSFVLCQCKDDSEMQAKVREAYKKEYDPKDPYSCQVLCAVKQGKAGVYELNRALQNDVNQNPTLLQTEYSEFRRGSKVMIVQNDYTNFVFNGDGGTVLDCDDDGNMTIQLGNDKEITYSPEDVSSNVDLSYALTIHKSQGSQFDSVIIALPANSNMLKRRLLYTGMTRAKKKVIIFYVADGLTKAIANSGNDRPRVTNLCEMLTRKEDSYEL